MATNFTIKITPDQLQTPGFPSFELKIKSSGIFFTDYKWSCPPGFMGAVSGVADFIDTGKLSILVISKKDWSVFDEKGDNPIYALLYHIKPDFAVGSSSWATIDFSGYKLKKKLEGNNSILQMIAEFWLSKKTNTHSQWEVIEAN